MYRLTSIVAVNQDGVIGVENGLPWRIRSDLRFFKQQTINNIVIMGRKTYESLNGSLPNRSNIVVTHGFKLFAGSNICKSAGSIEEALARAFIEKKAKQEVFVIGGASMYEQFAPFVDRYLITDVEKIVENGDTFFRRALIGDPSLWSVTRVLSGDASFAGDESPFVTYELKLKDSSVVEKRKREIIQSYADRLLRKSAETVRRRFALQQ